MPCVTELAVEDNLLKIRSKNNPDHKAIGVKDSYALKITNLVSSRSGTGSMPCQGW